MNFLRDSFSVYHTPIDVGPTGIDEGEGDPPRSSPLHPLAHPNTSEHRRPSRGDPRLGERTPEMPFIIRRNPYSMRFGIYKIHPDGSTTLSGNPRYKTAKSAIDTAVRWMQYRHEQPHVAVSQLGEPMVIPARYLSSRCRSVPGNQNV